MNDSGLLVHDLSSTHGTYIDRIRVQVGYLESGMSLRVGDVSMVVERLDEGRHEPDNEDDRFDGILGTSAAMRRVFTIIRRIATSEATVLLEGETGTGKTLIAKAIHLHSERRDGPFRVVDCSAIPPTLIEGELFGHERGSFTGAHTARAGAFESAYGGTVFLDEIGELLPELQPKLLRVLEERVIKRIGADKSTKLEIRLIAASNRDLRDAVEKGTFRSDLYYRLNTVKLRIPPLRERTEDIPLLVAHFYARFVGTGAPHPPLELMQWCLRNSWPGNVRELRSAVERAVLLGGPDALELSDGADQIPCTGLGSPFGEFDPEMSYRETKQRTVREFESWFVSELIHRHDGNLSRAARAARMDRNHLRDLLRRHNVPISAAPRE